MDMLVKLYPHGAHAGPAPDGVVVRKPLGPEHGLLVRWVAANFPAGWVSEVQVALANRPVSAWIALRDRRLAGFACYDATARGFFGPIGIEAADRGAGLGAALLRACLRDMRAVGYGYAVVGDAGAPAFFARVAAAVPIEGSAPGLYADRLVP